MQAFSGDELVFNDTMKDWRTHNGMDLAGAAGDAVTAPTGAVVARAYEDPQWGGVVELNAGKLTVRVCGLADIAVKEGDTVAVGDALGTVCLLYTSSVQFADKTVTALAFENPVTEGGVPAAGELNTLLTAHYAA